MSVIERIRINLLANYFRNFSKQRFKANCYQKCIKEIANIARVTRTASCSRNLVANICRNFRARFRFALIGGNLTAQSKGSHRWIGGGIQIPNSCFFLAIFVSECLTKSSCASFFVEIAKKKNNKASKFLLVRSILGISLLESHGKLQSYFLLH